MSHCYQKPDISSEFWHLCEESCAANSEGVASIINPQGLRARGPYNSHMTAWTSCDNNGQHRRKATAHYKIHKEKYEKHKGYGFSLFYAKIITDLYHSYVPL